MNFFDKVSQAIKQNHSLLCLGLDPKFEKFHQSPNITSSLVSWGQHLIEQTADLVCCYKPNIAFYEQFGLDGIKALQQTIALLPRQTPFILDAKRGDIGSTSSAYAHSIFDVFQADAVTINAYLGMDTLSAFLAYPEKAIFILCKTSNPSAFAIQDHGFPPLYLHMAEMAKTWGSVENLAFVIGATQVDSLRSVRQICPDHWFLCPGIGAQGGDLDAALNAGLRQDGSGIIIPVSRSITDAPDPREAALGLQTEIERVCTDFQSQTPLTTRQKLVEMFFTSGCIQFGNFTLASGVQSPFYIDIRRIISYPQAFQLVVQLYLEKIKHLECDLVSGVPVAALPISTLLAWHLNKPMIYTRKEAKLHGTGQLIEGAFSAGQKAVLVEDVITSGKSIISAVEVLRANGLLVNDVIVLVDRKQGGETLLHSHGINLHALLDIFEILNTLKDRSLIDAPTYQNALSYLAG